MNDCKEKTIHKEDDGYKYIYVYKPNSQKPTAVQRLGRKKRRKCQAKGHEFGIVSGSKIGHGKWRRGCLKCGALAR